MTVVDDMRGPEIGVSDQRRAVALLAGLALPSVLVYGIALLVYEMPIATRIGEQVFKLSGWNLGRAVATVGLALLI